jgi:hypothetical protein
MDANRSMLAMDDQLSALAALAVARRMTLP